MTNVQTHLRGYSSHEKVHEVGLVNMNARMYDPVIGRFIRDPSGHFGITAIALASAFFVAARLGNNPYLQIVSTVVLTVVTAGALKPITGAAGASALSSLTVSFVRQGKLTGNDLKNAALAASAGIAKGIGDMGLEGDFSWVVKAALHGSTQGVMSALRGDSFSNGMIAGTVSSLSGSAMGGMGLMDAGMTAARYVFARTMIAAGAAALTSRATGGDVLQGALTGATVHLFNHEAHIGQEEHVEQKDKHRKQTGPSWFKPDDCEYVVGRYDHDYIYDGRRGPGIGSFLDDYVPAAHTFGANHDRFVGYAVDELGLPDILINVPSMFIMYPAAIIQETLNSPTGIYNSIMGTDYEVPFPHQSPYGD